jgi:hypothetical protein
VDSQYQKLHSNVLTRNLSKKNDFTDGCRENPWLAISLAKNLLRFAVGGFNVLANNTRTNRENFDSVMDVR